MPSAPKARQAAQQALVAAQQALADTLVKSPIEEVEVPAPVAGPQPTAVPAGGS